MKKIILNENLFWLTIFGIAIHEAIRLDSGFKLIMAYSVILGIYLARWFYTSLTVKKD